MAAKVSSQLIQRVQRAVHTLGERVVVVEAYLFGSQLTGKTHILSDVDIGVFVNDLNGIPLRREMDLLFEIQREQGDDLEFHLFDAGQLPEPERGSFASWVVKNGVKIA